MIVFGEIDNIVKKAVMKEVITGVCPDFSEVLDMCRVEKLITEQNRIGFNV